ncbi:MAG: homocysteine biosynthesis protein [Candidatus Omnitrophica bacterium]|nr:homocysteine biosynthesis protein [Candidatus Omnitrophota bacterium]MBU1047502.1 homocysteine biosynthesis protein [Candidatus Omnitrophota bacterium]MBU1631033.1 homocysteine biosynthesis protein [Candidatus Omnitrophota bacterium]MBU1766686.1 homocysteine biosynthesis protein [Candidatus Omnitrophota bacterium]MBU1888865.1 homocysteine biosynthesis protein [Candidatus Omnitrophota bacterium]
MPKTIREINEKIKKGEAVIATAEEIIDIVEEKGTKKAAQQVDVVTTGTFGPMCSSGIYFNIGHSKPRIKIGGGTCYLNDVPAYGGFAAVDVYLGATALPDDDPKNKIYPGAFKYGGGHVIEEFVAGKDIKLVATGYGTDCYPRKKLETWINIKDVNEAVLFNPRNVYQNYNVAVNLSDKTIYTYMGILKEKLGNANFCSAGQLSPLLNDPLYKTVGIGTKIFVGGGVGYVAWQGTQHNPTAKRKDNNVPCVPAGTLAIIGDLKQMKQEWLRGITMTGYGVTLAVGIGIPIPILNEEIVQYTAVKDKDLFAQVVDYSEAYPKVIPGSLGEVNYAQLKSGKIIVQGKEIPTASLSSYSKAREIALTLKNWIKSGKFLLSEPVGSIPGPKSGITFQSLKERPIT